MKSLDTHLSRTHILNTGNIAAKGAKKVVGGGELDIAMNYGPPKLNLAHQHKQIDNISAVSKFHDGRDTIRKKMCKNSPQGGDIMKKV